MGDSHRTRFPVRVGQKGSRHEAGVEPVAIGHEEGQQAGQEGRAREGGQRLIVEPDDRGTEEAQVQHASPLAGRAG